MAWQVYQHHWPNGSAYYTVEDRRSNPRRVRIGVNHPTSKWHDSGLAQDECDYLNLKDQQGEQP